MPAITRHEHGDGVAWYAATRLDRESLEMLVARLVEEAGVRPIAAGRAGVELTERTDGDRRWVFVVNHTDTDAVVDVTGHDLVREESFGGRVPAGEVAVVRVG